MSAKTPNPFLPDPPPVPKDVTALLDIEYGAAPEKRLLLDLFLPPRLPKEPMPLLVHIHGGGWRGGSKEWRGDLREVRQGFASASINYRLSQEAIFPAQIHDCKGAIRFLRANAREYHIDPDRVGVWGTSAGGHLAALLGTSAGVAELEGDIGGNLGHSSAVQAVCDYCGPTDLWQYFALGGRRAFKPIFGQTIFDVFDQLLGGPLGRRRALARLANPVHFVSGNEPPFQIVHGDSDIIVPRQQSDILHAALRGAGVESTLVIVKGGGHGFSGADLDKAFDEFFEKHLKRGPIRQRAKA